MVGLGVPEVDHVAALSQAVDDLERAGTAGAPVTPPQPASAPRSARASSARTSWHRAARGVHGLVALLDRVSINGFRARATSSSRRRSSARSSARPRRQVDRAHRDLDAARVRCAPVPNASDVTQGANSGRIRLEAASRRADVLPRRPSARDAEPQPGGRAAGALLPDGSPRRRPRLRRDAPEGREAGRADLNSATDLSGAPPAPAPVEARVRGLVAPDRGARALPQPAGPAPRLPPLRSLAEREQPGPLLDPRIDVPQRRASRRARARAAGPTRGHGAPAAGAAPRRTRASARSRSSTRSAPRCSSRGPCCFVEGMTEKLALPFVFEALGYEPDSEGILVLETGGKANMPLFARICNECGIPYVVLHDRDAPRGKSAERVRASHEPGDRATIAGPRPRRPARAGLRERDRAEAAQPPQPQAGTRLPAVQRRPPGAGGARPGGRARRRGRARREASALAAAKDACQSAAGSRRRAS